MRSAPRFLIRISMRRWSGSWRGSEYPWLCGFVKRDGTVAGLQVDLWPVAADFAFQARIAVVAAPACFLERGIGEFRFNLAGMRICADFERSFGGQCKGNSCGRVGDVNVVLGRIGKAQLDVSIAVFDLNAPADIFHVN